MKKFLRERINGKRKDNKEIKIQRKSSVQTLILLIAGIFSIFLIIRSTSVFSFSSAVVLPLVMLVCVSLFVLHRINSRWMMLEIAGIHIVLAVILILQRGLAAEQLVVLYENLLGSSTREGTDLTFLVLLSGMLLSVWFFLFEIVWRLHWVPYIALNAILLGAPLFGISVGIFPVILGLFFQILFWTLHTAEKKRDLPDDWKRNRPRGSARYSAYMWGLLACLTGVSVILVSVFGTEISNIAFSTEGIISRCLQRVSGEAQHPAASGYVSGGNNYRTGETQMEAVLLEKPDDTLYLKGFTGSAYTGGKWEPADEQEIFNEMASVLEWEQWESWISGMYYTLYFSMNAISSENADHAKTVFLDYDAESNDTFYVPYYSDWISQGEYDRQGIGFYYYEESDMDINWENIPEDFAMYSDWYRQVQEAYQQVMQDVYTQVPEDLIPGMTELCRDRTSGSLEEATGFIVAVLQSEMEYTLTPGRTPVNQDVVEYALFDSHKGYCVHFASAATLMYRLLDIPARYVSGYAVDPSEFIQQEDGTWKAEVTDESAHAWTEIFLEDYGWTPVEVTPASDGSFTTSYPGMGPDALRNLAASVDFNIGSTAENGTSYSDEPDADDAAAEAEDKGVLFDPDRYHDQILILITALVEFVLFIPFLLHYRRLYRRSKLRLIGCREVFVRMIRMLRSEGYLTGYNGTEPEFAKLLSEKVPCIAKTEAEKMQEIILRVAYGRDMPSEEENEFVRKIYIRISGYIEGQLKGVAKFRFKYLSGNY